MPPCTNANREESECTAPRDAVDAPPRDSPALSGTVASEAALIQVASTHQPDEAPPIPRPVVPVLLIANTPCGLNVPTTALADTQRVYVATGLVAPSLHNVEQVLLSNPQRLVVADVRWCEAIGTPALQRLCRLVSTTEWLLCWPKPERQWLPMLLDTAARGALTCDATAAERARALDAVLAGELWLPRRVLQWLYVKYVEATEAGHALRQGSSPLTPRESEVMALLQRGMTNREIAVRLGVSINTVKKHLSSGFDKLGIHRRRQLVS